jgi:hypothetical protein
VGSIKRPIERVPCHYCQREVGDGALMFTWDHVVPRAMGGRNTRWNVVPSCQKCNSDKADEYPTHDCSFCRRSRRRHWEEDRITDQTKGRKRAKPGPRKRAALQTSEFERAQAAELRMNQQLAQRDPIAAARKAKREAKIGTYRDGWVKTEDGWALARAV